MYCGSVTRPIGVQKPIATHQSAPEHPKQERRQRARKPRNLSHTANRRCFTIIGTPFAYKDLSKDTKECQGSKGKLAMAPPPATRRKVAFFYVRYAAGAWMRMSWATPLPQKMPEPGRNTIKIAEVKP
ncbi:hypothetical protein GCM10011348_40890 [Marinobacterium nitratireducens]|uniref:Uncharacterized protein n=1 Tax=Marinobacterium nitratireducens TaxID=518897 RepID=A0A917ZMY6_9GAMM|nr:hypothetical protein GCM10011348_40890 [Marinobacterium nitratireducens]